MQKRAIGNERKSGKKRLMPCTNVDKKGPITFKRGMKKKGDSWVNESTKQFKKHPKENGYRSRSL